MFPVTVQTPLPMLTRPFTSPFTVTCPRCTSMSPLTFPLNVTVNSFGFQTVLVEPPSLVSISTNTLTIRVSGPNSRPQTLTFSSISAFSTCRANTFCLFGSGSSLIAVHSLGGFEAGLWGVRGEFRFQALYGSVVADVKLAYPAVAGEGAPVKLVLWRGSTKVHHRKKQY